MAVLVDARLIEDEQVVHLNRSPSMPVISATLVIFRRPPISRETWTTRCIALAI
jgi:hypothetical protein